MLTNSGGGEWEDDRDKMTFLFRIISGNMVKYSQTSLRMGWERVLTGSKGGSSWGRSQRVRVADLVLGVEVPGEGACGFAWRILF